jgi:hypothetical protein
LYANSEIRKDTGVSGIMRVKGVEMHNVASAPAEDAAVKRHASPCGWFTLAGRPSPSIHSEGGPVCHGFRAKRISPWQFKSSCQFIQTSRRPLLFQIVVVVFIPVIGVASGFANSYKPGADKAALKKGTTPLISRKNHPPRAGPMPPHAQWFPLWE